MSHMTGLRKRKRPKPLRYRASTLFAIVFGEIAHAIKEGLDPFRNLHTITLGYEPDADHPRCLIQDRDGQWFRLSVQPVQPPPPNTYGNPEWQPRREP